jgi:hypothetical protein
MEHPSSKIPEKYIHQENPLKGKRKKGIEATTSRDDDDRRISARTSSNDPVQPEADGKKLRGRKLQVLLPQKPPGAIQLGRMMQSQMSHHVSHSGVDSF